MNEYSPICIIHYTISEYLIRVTGHTIIFYNINYYFIIFYYEFNLARKYIRIIYCKGIYF